MRKETPMKNKIYIAIICAFSIVFAVSSGFLIKHYYDSAKQAEMYDNLIEVVETEPEETKEPMNYSEEKTLIPEYQELYLQNNAMVGWIKVEDTKINYPVMQSKDNPNFYLKHGLIRHTPTTAVLMFRKTAIWSCQATISSSTVII